MTTTNTTSTTTTSTATTATIQPASTTLCSTCYHSIHRPGQCHRCNCGQSEISYPTLPLLPGDLKFFYTSRNPPSSLATVGSNHGHRIPAKRSPY